jgi:uncharacterized protein YdhG (YjbR/CyaY superfamily)
MPPENASSRATEDETPEGFTAAERAAMKERSKELKASKRGKKADLEGELLAKVAEMPEPDRILAERLHELVKENAPSLAAKTWYGMPAYAKDGKVLCFFQAASKFGARYATLGFNDVANLDDGDMWPTAFALTALTPETEARIGELLRKAVS